MEAILELRVKTKRKTEEIQVKLVPGQNLVVGRKKGNLKLNHSKVSSSHCFFIFENNKIFLIDLDSTNGTIVNRKKISKIIVAKDDEINIGPFILLVSNITIESSVEKQTSPTIVTSDLIYNPPPERKEEEEKEKEEEGEFDLEVDAVDEFEGRYNMKKEDPKIFTPRWQQWIIRQISLIIIAPNTYFRQISHVGNLQTPLFFCGIFLLLGTFEYFPKVGLINTLVVLITGSILVLISTGISWAIVRYSNGTATFKACFRLLAFSSILLIPITIFHSIFGVWINFLYIYPYLWIFYGLHIAFRAERKRIIFFGAILLVLLITISAVPIFVFDSLRQ